MASFIPTFKQEIVCNHDDKLPSIFRMAIIGSSGSGKTVLNTQMLLQPNFFDYNKLYIYSKMINKQPEIKSIVYAFNKGLSKELIVGLFKRSISKNDFNKYVDEIAEELSPSKNNIESFSVSEIKDMLDENSFNEKNKNLIIFDDFLNDGNVNRLAESIFNNGRKCNINSIYLAQRYESIPLMVKCNLNFVIGFRQSKRDRDMFFNDVFSPFIDKKDFLSLVNRVWRKPHGYIAINLDSGEIYENLFFKND